MSEHTPTPPATFGGTGVVSDFVGMQMLDAYKDHLDRMEALYEEHLRELRIKEERIRYAREVG